MKNIVSYAQNREDIIIDAFFNGKSEGFYVDLSANHPTKNSVTKLFHNKGWRGINFELNEKSLNLLQADRPEDKNIKIVRSLNSKIDISAIVNHLEALGVKSIDFMKVDLEGIEYEPQKNDNKQERLKPELICIKADQTIKNCQPILQEADYIKFFNDGLNDYYAVKDSINLKEFSYPEKVLMRYPRIEYFTPNTERVSVNSGTYQEIAKDIVPNVSVRLQLRWSLNGLFSAIQQAFFIAIIKKKRHILLIRIEKSLFKNQDITPSIINKKYLNLKLQALRAGNIAIGIAIRTGSKIMRLE